MTKEALQEQHRMIIGLNNGSSEDATKLSIQYAISVLEEFKNGPLRNFPGLIRDMEKKINELKSQQ